MTPRALLMALLRRWKFALTIAVPVAGIVIALAGMVIPAHFTAFSLLRIAEIEPRLVFKTAEGGADFHTYRKTQVALIKSPLVLNAALRIDGIAQLPMLREKNNPVPWLQEEIQVASYHSPEILKLSLSGKNPEHLAKIVNAVKDAYLAEVVNKEQVERAARLNELMEIHARTEEKVRQKEERVNKLAKQLGTGDSQALTIKQQMALEYFRELQREHTRARFDLMRAEVASATMKLDDADPETEGDTQQEIIAKSDAAPDPSLELIPENTRADIISRRAVQLRQLIKRYEQQVVDKNHPALQEYRQELARLEASAMELGGTSVADTTTLTVGGSPSTRAKQIELLRRQEATLREEVDKYSKLVKNIGESSFELELMQNEIEQIAKVSQKVGDEMEALRIELKSPSRVTLVQKSVPPRTLDVTRKHRLMGAAGAGAFGFVLLAIALNEFRVRRIGAPSDLTDVLNLDVLGTLPALPRKIPGLTKKNPHEQMALWNNALIESIDGIRSVLLHGTMSSDTKTIMVCSAASGEGKTTFACQLAGSLARSGKKTVLVDCDLRRPTSHTLLHTPLEPGLSEFLDGDLHIENIVHQTQEANLWSVPAGQLDQAALTVLARDGAKAIFDVLRANFDYIIVDSAPVLYVADTASIARNIDGVVVAARHNVSRLPLTATACERLALLGVPILGSVLIGVQATNHGYSYDYNFRKQSIT